MSDNNLNKLKAILREMFQLDQADLDFGIYRIMNQKRDEIEQFLDRDLLPQVKSVFADLGSGTKADLQEELSKMKVEIERLGYVAEENAKYIAKKTELDAAVDISAAENEVFSQLTNFFRRYYQSGDFLSLRRYKADVYAIPYEGEEVKLHWANADQYYIKSSENFRDYTFKLPSGKRAHFKLVDASTEQNNKKEQAGKERQFFLSSNPPTVEGDDFSICFEYREEDKPVKEDVDTEQEDIADGTDTKKVKKEKKKSPVQIMTETILSLDIDESFRRDFTALSPTPKNSSRTLLEKHLNDYTAKSKFDYFIHKDLGGFLRRELDFFVKNEVLFIDDLDVDHIKATISKVKVIKEIGHKVIAFLEQLENFQKKLWLKKKFVVETGYCCTLDKVPEELYPTVIANGAQVEEWRRLFAIQEIEGDLHTPKYSDPLTIEFLKANPFLLIDTSLFDREFTEKLLASFDNLDEATDGLLINSDNFQALNLMLERYKKKVKCVHIDPPYNTATSGFLYKNDYKHSSWLSMMENRLSISTELMTDNASLICHIDENEYEKLHTISTKLPLSDAGTIVWDKRNPMNGGSGVAKQHEYIIWLMKTAKPIIMRNKNIISMLSMVSKLMGEEGEVNENVRRQYSTWINNNEDLSGGEKAYRYIDDEGCIYQSVSLRAPEPRQDKKFHLPLIHPKTLKPCPVPPNGFSRTPETLQEMIDAGKILFGSDETTQPRQKVVLTEDTSRQLPSLIQDAKKGKADTAPLGIDFPYCHPVSLYEELLGSISFQKDIILDFFAGSGTTGHATIKLNRDDGENRKYILVEMGNHFDTALKPRIQKVIYSKDWKDGKPLSREGSSHLFKYIRLESYEDALNNLQLKRTPEQGSLLDQHDKLREQYMLSYMLDVESAGSTSLLNVSAFADPFAYRMNIARSNETKETVVDLVETFNWLLGIKVLRISQKEYRTADFETDAEGRLQISGRARTCGKGEGWTFQEVEGQTLSGDKVLVIWRTLTDKPEQDNLMLDAWFGKRNYNTLDFEFSRIYVNGDNNLENLKIGEERWKVALIEQEFKKLMFDVEGV